MASVHTRAGKDAPPWQIVKMDRVLARKAKLIADDQGSTLFAYLDEGLRARIESDWLSVKDRHIAEIESM